MPATNSLASVGRWLLDSGIQDSSGGFARFYDAETGKNRPVSTEITGYAASALVYLFQATGDEMYLSHAWKTARFLVSTWDKELRTFPFEYPSQYSYFFDCGIIIRGLLAVWRETKEDQLLETSAAAAHAMIADFHSGRDYHPILSLPNKEPSPRTEKWSRNPGCYQLKAAMAWWDVGEITGDTRLKQAYGEMLRACLSTHSEFLPGASCPQLVMDRLHAYCYFLEGMLPMRQCPDCIQASIEGIGVIQRHLKDIEPTFVRSDVYAQLLRARVNSAPFLPVDNAAAATEAKHLADFHAVSDDPRIGGGFFFGRREGRMSPQVNPVSSVFAAQALEMWRQYQVQGEPSETKPSPCLPNLI
ncbi:MAG TPA: hypothetical protein VGL82_13705 [Bryobacteraceae bacterium]